MNTKKIVAATKPARTMPLRGIAKILFSNREVKNFLQVTVGALLAVFILLATAQANDTGYGGSWYISNFWSGEYPQGFSVVRESTVVMARNKMDKNAARDQRCELPYLAVINPWNADRIRTSKVQFFSATKIIPLITKEDFNFNGYFGEKQVTVHVKKGEILKYLRNDSEGSFEIEIAGKQYTADQDLFDHVDEVPDNLFVEEDWVLLTCEEGNRAYIFLPDIIFETQETGLRYAPGVADVGPGQVDYGKARDLTKSEARRLQAETMAANENDAARSKTLHDSLPATSTSLGLCAAAINNPLRQMIIDVLVFDGKHLGGRLDNLKHELENDYGSFLNVHDDATVEKVDQHTGKIGCAVTYDTDLKGLAGKVLNEGATGRAQVLIRRIGQDGPRISRRLTYTVQETSGGSFMVWLGITADTAESHPVRRHAAVYCILAYGGRCVVLRR